MPKSVTLTTEEAALVSAIFNGMDEYMQDDHPAIWIVCGKMIDADTAGINHRYLNLTEDGMIFSKDDSGYTLFQSLIKKLNKL